MFFQIDTTNGVPVYEQVVRQVVFAVANGALRHGEMVPSVRQLARHLAINPNTVARAYRQLQDLSVLETVRGTGLQIAAGSKPICKSQRTKLLRERFGQIIDEDQQSQLDDDEILKLFQNELSKKRKKKA